MKRNEYGIPIHLQEEIVYSLKIAKKIFDANNIKYWLEAGTLIGAVREGRVLLWDNDGDISFDIKDAKKIYTLKSEFKKYGLQLKGFISYRIVNRNKRHCVCIMPSHVQKGYYVKTRNAFAELYNWIEKRHIPLERFDFSFAINFLSRIKAYNFIRGKVEWIFPLRRIEFYGELFFVPRCSDNYLTFRFGNWRKSDKYLCDRKRGMKYHKRF
jgi:hypothetical protein